MQMSRQLYLDTILVCAIEAWASDVNTHQTLLDCRRSLLFD